MDSLMLAITAAAMAMAVVMTFVAVRLLRGERQRRAARIAALEHAAVDDVLVDDDAPIAVDVRFSGPDAFDAFRDDPPAAMFAATDEPKAPGRRWLALGAVAVIMAALAGGTYVILKPEALSAWTGSTPRSPDDAGPASASAAPSAPASDSATAPQTRPIELLSLKHTIDAGTFTLVGLVDNPIDARPLSHVIAVVYLFDKDGAYVATGKADLAFTGLRPGEESPFTIKVANVGRIGKYRVGFRRDDGSVIAHVDKRGTGAGTMTEGQ